jgi:hypothetical protein
VIEPDRNVTPSTTDSSRLSEIRARLDAYGAALAARRDGTSTPATENDAATFRDRARSDIAWLLDELEVARASAERYRTQLVNVGRFDA